MKYLQEKSPIYFSEADVYEAFAQAEDAGQLVLEVLKPLVTGKSVLDLGCGTGKYLELLAPHAAHITGIDAAAAQLGIARQKTGGLANVALVQGDAADAVLARETYDVVLACWMLGTIAEEIKRKAILNRFSSPGTRFILVENAEGSEFEDIRGRVNDPLLRTRRYNDWLLAQGFTETHRLDAWFAFRTAAEAQDIFAAIWGDDKRKRVTSRRIEHKIAIYQRVAI